MTDTNVIVVGPFAAAYLATCPGCAGLPPEQQGTGIGKTADEAVQQVRDHMAEAHPGLSAERVDL